MVFTEYLIIKQRRSTRTMRWLWENRRVMGRR